MGTVITGIFAALLVVTVLALPSNRIRRDTEIATRNFVGEGTNELATAILQGFVDTDENLAFSPLGHSVLLAILAEGANGDTREQLVKAIHLPDNMQLRRSAYKDVLERLTEKYSTNKPQFKNWFYIYKNFSVEPEYKKNLQENYLTDVRDVDRLDNEVEDNSEVSTESNEEKKDESTMPEKMDDLNMEDKLKDKPEKVEDPLMSENTEDSKSPEKMEDTMMPEKSEDTMMSEEMNDSKNPEKIDDSMMPEDSKMPEKVEDTVMPEKSEDSKLPEKMEDQMMPEKSEDSKIPEETEDTEMTEKSDDSKIPEKMEDSVMPEKMEESMKPEMVEDSKNPEKSEDIKMDDEIKPENSDQSMSSDKTEDKVPEKIESSNDKEEIMQESDVEAPSKDKDTLESRRFSSSFDYEIPSTLRKLEEEKESKPNDEVITMQQEMLGDKKEDKVEEMQDDNKQIIGDEVKENQKEEIKEDTTESDEKQKLKDEEKVGLIDKIKNDFMDSIKEIIKDDKKEEEKEEITNEETGEMKEDMKDEIKQDLDINNKEEKTEMVKDEIKENCQNEEMKTEEKDKKEDAMAGVMMEEGMNMNPMSEEKLIQEEMKQIKERQYELEVERNSRSLDFHRTKRGIYLEKNDVSSSLSGNNIVVKSAKNKKISQILVFNAMFFKGNWAVPFTRQKIDSFYKSYTEKSTVTMMGTQGTFRVGNIPDLDSMAIELPYQGDRYSLLIVMPNSRTGLRQLISDLTGYPLRNIQNYLNPQEVEVCLPSFEIQTTSNPVEALRKLGVTDVFNQEEADLTGISKDSGLFVEELVQYVTVKVDESSSSYNYMTASNPSVRTAMSKYSVDSPFLYFVRDIKENIIIVAGKVVDPSITSRNL